MGLNVGRWSIICLIAFPVSRANAQTYTVRGVVTSEEDRAPLRNVSVRTVLSQIAGATDRFGRFALQMQAEQDTLIVAYIGRSPVRIAINRDSGVLLISLRASAIPLNDVVVSAGGSPSKLHGVNRWELPAAALRLVPSAIEVDPLRSLSLIPAVTYSTPLSSRPIIRGYDADHTSIRLDGFDMVNPFHIGRFFGALPAEAVQQVAVGSAPLEAGVGGTVAGIIDVTGRVGPTDSTRGGTNLSLISASPWMSGGQRSSWFGAGRFVHLSALDHVTSSSIPYNFQDIYLGGSLAGDEGQRVRVTAFGSRDDLFDQDDGVGMKWSNVLLGVRSRVWETPGIALDVAGVTTRFAEKASNVGARFAHIDIENRFGRTGANTDLTLRSRRTSFGFGAGFYRRAIKNRIHLRSGEGFGEQDTDITTSEINGYAQLEQSVGGATVQIGLRGEASPSVTSWQPRVRIHLPLGSNLGLGVGVGRTARLFHLISDPRSEPDVAFYDFWLSAGEGGIPLPRIDHASLDLNWIRSRVGLRVSGFGSRGEGIGELRPTTDHTVSQDHQFRFGETRTFGIEAQAGAALGTTGASSVSLSYVLSWSERKWAGQWVPWSQDRRHVLRLFIQKPMGRWKLVGTIEAASGLPLTPVSQVITTGIPDSTGQGRESEYIFGAENSARSSGTLRGDVGVTYVFKGPWKSRMSFGFSVMNVGFGPVAPIEAKPLAFGSTVVRYERLFDLPAIPTATFRIEF